MLGIKQKRAVALLFEMTEAEVAKTLRISRATLDAWKAKPEFVEAVQQHLKDNRQASIRMLSRINLDACREAEAMLRSDDDKNKPRLIMDLLKASGLTKEAGFEEADPVGDIMRRFSNEEDLT